ncbi:MAG: restriction endonuclease subunit S [Acidithiobacillus ferrooxidans]|jgi:type I restriction enzyme S subunit
MSLAHYQKYKESDNEWLGDVPAGWGLVPMKTVATCNDDVLSESTDELYSIEYVEISDIDSYSGITKTSALQFGEAPSRARRIIKHGDILVSTVRTYLRAIAAVDNPPDNLIASTGFAVIRPRRIESGFLGYLFQAEYLVSKIISYSVGVSYPAINASELMRFGIPFPPLEEQQAIAAFLDAETARIDALIAEYETLIELLKEKRQALISHAVTKGLNPDVPMKDSGVEWLGEVPEHWSVKAIKWESTVQRGASPRPIEDPIYFDDEGEYAWVRISDVTASNVYLWETEQRLSHIGEKLSVKLQPGTLFLSIAGSVGKPCITEIKCCIHDGFVWFPAWRKSTKFIYYVFASGQPYKGLGKMGTQLNLNTDTIGSIYIGMPSLEEQCAIAAFLDTETARMDALVQEAEIGINLLRERRTTLISDAVTGKIDVRDWQEVA